MCQTVTVAYKGLLNFFVIDTGGIPLEPLETTRFHRKYSISSLIEQTYGFDGCSRH